MPLEKAAPGTPGFSHNISEMMKSGHGQAQAIAAAYRASGEGDCSMDALFAAADALYSRSDAMQHGRWDSERDLSGPSTTEGTVDKK